MGTVLILWYLSTLFSTSFQSLDGAMSASFETLEAVAITSRAHFVK